MTSTPRVLCPICKMLLLCLRVSAAARSVRDARHAAPGAGPHLALGRDGQRINVFVEQAFGAPEVLPPLAVPARDAAVGAEPERAVGVLGDRIDDVAGQAVLGGEVGPLAAVEA